MVLSLLGILGCVCASAERASAQVRFEVRDGDVTQVDLSVPPGSGVIDEAPEIAHLLEQAADGMDREDWKLTVDSLQRMIEHPRGGLVLRGDREARGQWAQEGVALYESARRRALRLLADPLTDEEVLAAYRRLYDGKAQRLYEQGVQDADRVALRTVVDRYLMTRWGGPAAERLAAWALDVGKPAEAAELLTEVRLFVPAEEQDEARVTAMEAVAVALLGQRERAETRTADLAELPGGAELAPHLQTWFEQQLWASDAVGSPAELAWSGAWPVAGGDGRRCGTMPAVEPMLVEQTPWRFDAPGRATDPWGDLAKLPGSGQVALPASQLVAMGEHVFARSDEGCVALDAGSLHVVWRKESSTTAEVRKLLGGDASAIRWDRGRPTRDGVPRGLELIGQQLSVGGGLVFLIEPQSFAVEAAREIAIQMRAWGRQARTPFGLQTKGGRLEAYDATTGEVRWYRGRTDDPNDRLGEAHFLSTPLAVGADLWVPVLLQRDLYVAVLSPENGDLEALIPLCSFEAEWQVANQPMPLAAAGDLVFVCTGKGLLYAIDVQRRSLRWAVQYNLQSSERMRFLHQVGRTWYPDAPVVAGDLVIVAPSDRTELTAWSIEDGTRRWSQPYDHSAYSYVVGADERHIWLGGRHVACVSTTDGRPVWEQAIEQPDEAGQSPMVTGRAILAGERMLVPTSAGLTEFDAVSGAMLRHDPLPSTAPPLGNLLSYRGGLFSVSEAGVFKYPDTGKAYVRTRAAWEADPTRVVAGMSLAWLELFRGAPAEARAVLDAVALLSDPAGEDAEEWSRLQVEVALVTAADPGVDHAEAYGLLEAAAGNALTDADRWRCRLVMAELRAKQGAIFEACQQLWSLGMRPDARKLLHLNAGAAISARAHVRAGLRALVPRLSAGERQTFQRWVRRQAEEAAAALNGGAPKAQRAAMQTLAAVAELDVGPAVPIAAWASLKLGILELERQRFPRAELRLSAAVRGVPSDDPIGRAAQMMLWHVYDHPDVRLPTLRAAVERRLREEHGRATVPAFYPGATQLQDTRISDWLDAQRPPAPLLPEESEASIQGGLAPEYAWTKRFMPPDLTPHLLEVTDAPPGYTPDRFLTIYGGTKWRVGRCRMGRMSGGPSSNCRSGSVGSRRSSGGTSRRRRWWGIETCTMVRAALGGRWHAGGRSSCTRRMVCTPWTW
jgi:outer membrane protein assembly factor BamB